MRSRASQFIAVALSAALTFTMVGSGTAQALISTTQPQLALNRLIRTSPPLGSTTRLQDNEGSAYVAGDDALWMASDNDDALFEFDRTTGAQRRKVAQSAFINAPRFGVGGTAGQARTEDLEALAYDANADVIYAFSGSTSATPTAFRLTRDATHQFQVESWQPLPSEFTGAGWRAADGLTYVANGAILRTYAYATNTLGPSFSISGLSSIYGIDFDDVTGDLLAVNSSERLYRASMTTRTLLTGWNGISLTGFGLLDTRAVEVIGEQVFVTDGADSAARSTSDPMSHAVFVLDVTGPGGTAPTASFTATPTSGSVPLTVNFTDTSTGGPTSWAWNFGDGTTSTAQSPSHTYTAPCTCTATLTATNGQGPSTPAASRTITVNQAPTELTVPLDADTYVNTGSPTKNYGSYAYMKLHGVDADYRSLVRFTLSGLSGAPSSVKLRLYVTDASSRGGDWYLVSNDWTESTVVWGNKPAISGNPVASVGAVSVGTWVEIDLTSAITGNGTYSFEATSTSTNTTAFSTSQGANPPQVVVIP